MGETVIAWVYGIAILLGAIGVFAGFRGAHNFRLQGK
jgi:hypothetical protein